SMADIIVRAEVGGLQRSFADAGPMAVALAVAAVGFLRESGDLRVSEDYLARLSDTLDQAAVASETDAAPVSLWDSSVYLTARERDLLGRVQHGLTNKEIAQDLEIGIETVKWHLKNIFGKLKARNRTEAIAYLQQIDRGTPPL
ncbi:LuxR C-terminal-related transcriptional regulator, partial [Rhizobiaceae sp. 2RAB30]